MLADGKAIFYSVFVLDHGDEKYDCEWIRYLIGIYRINELYIDKTCMNTALRIMKGTCVLIEIRDITIYGYELLTYKYLQYPLLIWLFVYKM